MVYLKEKELTELKNIYNLIDSNDEESILLGISLLKQEFSVEKMCPRSYRGIQGSIMVESSLQGYIDMCETYGYCGYYLKCLKQQLSEIINQKYYVFPVPSYYFEPENNVGESSTYAKK